MIHDGRLVRMQQERRNSHEYILGLINDCSTNRADGEALVDMILGRRGRTAITFDYRMF
jgi:hypothetical protein